jgi:hypothetical protein
MNEASPRDIIVGINTHKHTQAAVAVTGLGARVGELTIRVGLEGYRELEAWAQSLGAVRAFGIEGTGAYGAGLARFLRAAGLPFVRPAGPIAGGATGMAKRTTSMPKAPPAPCWVGRPRLCPRPAPVRWR